MPISLRLPDDISVRLQKLAQTTGRIEDLYLAEQRLLDHRAGKTQALPLEEVMRRYGWRVELDSTAERELDNLDPQRARRILSFLHGRVAMLDDPLSIGESLKGSKLGEFWKYRVGATSRTVF